MDHLDLGGSFNIKGTHSDLGGHSQLGYLFRFRVLIQI